MKTMKQPKIVISEKERIETLTTVVGKTVPELQKEVDEIINKAISGTATPEEKKRAAVLATVISDRTGSLSSPDSV